MSRVGPRAKYICHILRELSIPNAGLRLPDFIIYLHIYYQDVLYLQAIQNLIFPQLQLSYISDYN